MSANLEQSKDGRVAFVNAGDRPGPAWHGLGQEVDEALSAEEAGRLAHLNGWDVHTVPVFGARKSGSGMSARTLALPNHRATVRTNPFTGEEEGLGVVGKRYRPVQNEDAFSLADHIVGESGAHFHTAGSLGKGEKVFMSLHMPDGIMVGGADAHDLYLVVANSHDGSGALQAIVSPVRVVCQNTLNLAIRGAKSRWSMRHTLNVDGKIAAAREALGVTFEYVEAFEKEAEAMLLDPFTNDEMAALLKEHIIPDPESEADGWVRRAQAERDRVMWLFAESETNEFGRGSKYAAYNAVVEWADWLRPGNATTRAREALGLDIVPNERAQKALALLRK
jgi:phage/plasmid-like protein (TIGR03299 family)